MSPPIFTPDGTEVSEIVLPDGSTASQVIGPDGNVVFEAGPDIPDSDVYLHDDFGDNKLQNRDGSGTTTHNGVEGVYRPEWTIENGSPTVSNEELSIVGGDRIYTGVNIDLSSVLTVEATVDASNTGSLLADQINIGIFAEQVTDVSFDQYHQAYYISILGQNTVQLRYRDASGANDSIIEGSYADSDRAFSATRQPDGTFELFVEGVSQGTATDTQFENPQFAPITGRDNGQGSINQVKWS